MNALTIDWIGICLYYVISPLCNLPPYGIYLWPDCHQCQLFPLLRFVCFCSHKKWYFVPTTRKKYMYIKRWLRCLRKAVMQHRNYFRTIIMSLLRHYKYAFVVYSMNCWIRPLMTNYYNELHDRKQTDYMKNSSYKPLSLEYNRNDETLKAETRTNTIIGRWSTHCKN